jgi:hypothetical protein
VALSLGIVGSEGKKFTATTEQLARVCIRELLDKYTPSRVVSGACHLGGIDVWAIDEAAKRGITGVEHPPASRVWSGGYKERNIRIAEDSDVVVCITIKDLPPDFEEHGWERYCYHCGTSEHIKSGGCWTTKYARKIGKSGYTIVLDAELV